MRIFVLQPSLTAISWPLASFSHTVDSPQPSRRAVSATDNTKGLSEAFASRSCSGEIIAVRRFSKYVGREHRVANSNRKIRDFRKFLPAKICRNFYLKHLADLALAGHSANVLEQYPVPNALGVSDVALDGAY